MQCHSDHVVVKIFAYTADEMSNNSELYASTSTYCVLCILDIDSKVQRF